ncbi:hypothetical protein AB4Y89_20975 [Terriglobus sp. 2YAB30_2]|uniref:hypothetical protein n=1 Tax=unclassified Terriglobus TaxID=2628988 RepID=UPI003F9792EE
MHRNCLLTLLAAATLTTTITAAAQEKKITKDQLPAAVLATIDRETSGAIIKGYATEREHGKLFYEVETVVNGHTRDLQIAPDGTLTEVEEEVVLESLSGDVRTGLLARAKGARIVKVESLTKQGTLVAYEAAVEKNGRHSEVQVGPSGKPLTHEE